MSFLKKLFGGGNKPEASAKRSGTRPAPSGAKPARPPAGPPPERVRTPTLAETAPRQLHVYFEYVGGASSKFYAISLEEEADDTWRVRFNFGRIGSPRAWASRVEGVSWKQAATAYSSLVDEREGKGYELRPWPAYLTLPDGSSVEDDGSAEADGSLFRAAKRGTLPPASGGTVDGIALPDGRLYAPRAEGGTRGSDPVIWASQRPVSNVAQLWSQLAAVFPETGLWPFVIDDSFGFSGFGDYLMDVPRGRHTEVLTILRRGWGELVDLDDEPGENSSPSATCFPGSPPRPRVSERPRSITSSPRRPDGSVSWRSIDRPTSLTRSAGWARRTMTVTHST